MDEAGVPRSAGAFYRQGYNAAHILAGLDDAKGNVRAALKKHFFGLHRFCRITPAHGPTT